MLGKAIITKKPDGIAFQDIKSIGITKSTGSTGSAGFRNIWVQEKCWKCCLGQKMVFTSTSSTFSTST
jgi:hypothetical protein